MIELPPKKTTASTILKKQVAEERAEVREERTATHAANDRLLTSLEDLLADEKAARKSDNVGHHKRYDDLVSFIKRGTAISFLIVCAVAGVVTAAKFNLFGIEAIVGDAAPDAESFEPGLPAEAEEYP